MSYLLNQLNCRRYSEAVIAKKIQSKEYWHKFVIKNGATSDKDKLLHSVLEAVSPCDLVPVKYTISGDDSYFLARNCENAIKKLCDYSLTVVSMPDSSFHQYPIYFNIHLCYVEISKQPMTIASFLKDAIERRLKSSPKGTINLSNFHKESELNEVLFCPLAIPRFLLYVLKILKKNADVEKINLSNNNIKDLKSLEAYSGCDTLIGLDLSNNKIDDLDSLKVIKSYIPNLQEINLNGNPICSLYSSPLQYTKTLLLFLPKLRIIDSVGLDLFLPIHRIWLCNNEAENLVNQFIEHYYRLYDCNRHLLEHTYHKNAIFSIMSNEKIEVKPTADHKLKCYHDQRRNVLKINNEFKIIGHINRNREEIMKSLMSLPKTEHDIYSFKIDVPFHESKNTVITVAGVFKDNQDSKPWYRSFNRTFVLIRTSEDEYKIINDLFQVTNASELEIENSFLKPNPLKFRKKKKKPIANLEERKNMVILVSKFTDMNEKYSTKCLEDVNWNVKKALETFLENYTSYKIPPEAFTD